MQRCKQNKAESIFEAKCAMMYMSKKSTAQRSYATHICIFKINRSTYALQAFCPLRRRKIRNIFRGFAPQSLPRQADRAARPAPRAKSRKDRTRRQTPATASLNPSLWPSYSPPLKFT